MVKSDEVRAEVAGHMARQPSLYLGSHADRGTDLAGRVVPALKPSRLINAVEADLSDPRSPDPQWW